MNLRPDLLQCHLYPYQHELSEKDNVETFKRAAQIISLTHKLDEISGQYNKLGVRSNRAAT